MNTWYCCINHDVGSVLVQYLSNLILNDVFFSCQLQTPILVGAFEALAGTTKIAREGKQQFPTSNETRTRILDTSTGFSSINHSIIWFVLKDSIQHTSFLKQPDTRGLLANKKFIVLLVTDNQWQWGFLLVVSCCQIRCIKRGRETPWALLTGIVTWSLTELGDCSMISQDVGGLAVAGVESRW
jgi:hypothetical protein